MALRLPAVWPSSSRRCARIAARSRRWTGAGGHPFRASRRCRPARGFADPDSHSADLGAQSALDRDDVVDGLCRAARSKPFVLGDRLTEDPIQASGLPCGSRPSRRCARFRFDVADRLYNSQTRRGENRPSAAIHTLWINTLHMWINPVAEKVRYPKRCVKRHRPSKRRRLTT